MKIKTAINCNPIKTDFEDIKYDVEEIINYFKNWIKGKEAFTEISAGNFTDSIVNKSALYIKQRFVIQDEKSLDAILAIILMWLTCSIDKPNEGSLFEVINFMAINISILCKNFVKKAHLN